MFRASLAHHQEVHLYLNTHQPIGCSNYYLYIRFFYFSLMISPQFRMLEMMVWPSYCL